MSAGATGRRRRVGLAGVLVLAILVLALALRLKGIGYGLPFSFVNADESTVVPKAAAAARGHLDPQFFFYPSLYFYLAGALYVLAAPVWWLLGRGSLLSLTSFIVDPGPYFLLARLLSVAMGTASVYLVYRLGRVAFGRPAGLLAALLLAVAPLHVAYSHMAVTDVTAVALSLLALVLLQQAAGGGPRRGEEGDAHDRPADAAGLAAERRAARWLVFGAFAAGLATSTKYNLGMLVLPATVAAVFACRAEAARRVAAGGRVALVWLRTLVLRVYVPMLVAFVAGSPFVVLDAPHFLRDFRRQSQIMGRGWLGFEHVGNGFWYNVTPNLTGAIGVVLVVLGAAGLGWALWRRTRLDLMIAPYVIVYFVYIGTWKELADRYLLVIAPLLILLGVRFCVEAALLRPRARRYAVPVAAVVLTVAFVLPLSASLAFDLYAERRRYARGRAHLDPAARPGGIADRRGELRTTAGARGPTAALPRRGPRPCRLPRRAPQAPGARHAGAHARPGAAARAGRAVRGDELARAGQGAGGRGRLSHARRVLPAAGRERRARQRVRARIGNPRAGAQAVPARHRTLSLSAVRRARPAPRRPPPRPHLR